MTFSHPLLRACRGFAALDAAGLGATWQDKVFLPTRGEAK